jgi:hypothetical protein
MAVSRINEAGLNVNQYGNRNVIINGAMQVAQRGTSFTGLGGSTGAVYTLDRFLTFDTATAGRATVSQETDSPNEFGNSLKVACTTADTSVAAGEIFLLTQRIEGQNVQRFAKGTSEAKEYTVSFYVKANASATYVCELFDNDNSRQISKTFSVTTSWTRVVLTFPADTTGAFDDDNAGSLYLNIFLHAGSNFTSGTLNSTSWASNTNANRAVGIDSFFDSTSRTFFITGVQLEVGDTATDFEHRTFSDDLTRCQRYYNRSYPYGTATAAADNNTPIHHMSRGGNYNIIGQFFHPRDMRATPTVVLYNPNNGTVNQLKGDSSSYANAAVLANTAKGACMFVNNTAITETVFISVHATFEAEL